RCESRRRAPRGGCTRGSSSPTLAVRRAGRGRAPLRVRARLRARSRAAPGSALARRSRSGGAAEATGRARPPRPSAPVPGTRSRCLLQRLPDTLLGRGLGIRCRERLLRLGNRVAELQQRLAGEQVRSGGRGARCDLVTGEPELLLELEDDALR